MEPHTHPPPKLPSNKGLGMTKILVYALAAVALVLILMRFYKGGNTAADFSHIPKEVQINYIPSDFDYTMDDENALAILTNPYRYAKEFNELIYDFNLSLLFHVANRMNLPDSIKSELKTEYEKHHPYLRRLYFNDFVALQDTTSVLYRVWYENAATSSVEILNEVASKYTCFLVHQILATLLKTDGGKIYAKGNKVETPCGVAMAEGLKPMIDRLEEKAAIEDFTSSKGFMKERVEKAIVELATMEVRDRKGISSTLQTKIWGMNVSSTDVEISAVSILKVGFDLQKYFDLELNEKRGVVTVTLPEPQVLSHEVYPRVDKLDIGWMREVKELDFNKNIDLLRKEFRSEGTNKDIYDKAKKRVGELMDTILTPLISSINKKYILKVKFKNVNREMPPVEETEPF